MSKWFEEFKKKINSMSKEKLDKEWEKLKKYNDVGPTIDEYIDELKKWGLYANETV